MEDTVKMGGRSHGKSVAMLERLHNTDGVYLWGSQLRADMLIRTAKELGLNVNIQVSQKKED